MELLALVSTRLDVLRAGLLAAALPREHVRVACYLRYRSAFDQADLDWLHLQAVSWLLPTQGEPASRVAEAIAWSGECLGELHPHLLLLGDSTEAMLPFALTASKSGSAIACLEAGMPGRAEFEAERTITERLATFRLAPCEQAAAWLQEAGLECQHTVDVLAEAAGLTGDLDPSSFFPARGLAPGRYAAAALELDRPAPAVAGLSTVHLPGVEGRGGAEGPEGRALKDWVALLTHSGSVLSDDLGICRLAAGAGIGTALITDGTEAPAWLGSLTTVLPLDAAPPQIEPIVPARPGGGSGARELARFLTKGG